MQKLVQAWFTRTAMTCGFRILTPSLGTGVVSELHMEMIFWMLFCSLSRISHWLVQAYTCLHLLYSEAV